MPEAAPLMQQVARYIRFEELDLATLAKYAEAVELRAPAELADELLAASLESGVIFPVIVTEDGKIIDGYRRIAALLSRYRQLAERRAVRVPALVISKEVKIPPEVLRFVATALQRPVKSVEQCSSEMVDAIVRRVHYSVMEMCPVCRAALLLDAYGECGPGTTGPCVPPGMKRAVHAIAARCVELLERLVLYMPLDAASREVARARDAFASARLRVHPEVERVAGLVERRARSVLEAEAARRAAAAAPVTTRTAVEERREETAEGRVEEGREEARPLPVPPAAESRREEAREEEKREEMPVLAGEVPEEVRGSLLYIERLVTETAREEVERAVERKRRLYSMAKGAGMPDAIARLVVYMFNLDEVEQMVAVYRQMPDSHAFIKMLAERVDSFRSAKSLTVSDETLSMLGEIANTYAYPLPFLVQDIVRAVYTRFSTGEYKTLRELLDAVAGRGA